ncbi:MAG TPA: hypothetical protein VGC21_11965 [Telluria sp.]|jgi:hypothetical protein
MSNSEQKANPPIPTHPADPSANGDEAKVVGNPGAVRNNDYNVPPPEGASKSSGEGLDQVGGGGLGKPPGK